MHRVVRLRLVPFVVFALLLSVSLGTAHAKSRAAPVLHLDKVRVDIEIDGALVTTQIEQTWRNSSSQAREIDLLLPIPPGAAVTDYAMTIDSEPLPATLLRRDEARKIYQETVRRLRDPALLKHQGDDAVRARAFPVPPGKTRTLHLRYKQLVAPASGILRHAVVPAPDRPEHDRIGELEVNVRVAADAPIVAVYSPTHKLEMRRNSATRAVATHRQAHARPGEEILVYVATSEDEVGLNLITYREPGEDGYFLLLGAPAPETAETKRASRTVLFVIDHSGSMKGRKIEQVKGALRFCLNSLEPEDRFNLVTFNDQITTAFDAPLPATKENVGRVLERVRDLVADRGTNIQDALYTALDQVPAGAPADVVFLTDGLPTVGERDANKIRDAVAKRNEGRARLFTFGVGDDVNITFLDKLALEARGFPTVVRPTEDVEVAVSNFFRAITAPALTELSLRGEGVALYDAFPKDLPDLFRGSTLTVTGRYRGDGEGALVLAGKRDGKTLEFRLPHAFPKKAYRADFLPSLWAARRIGHLIDDIRANGPEKELVDEVVSLAKRYGIVTEYTAFLLELDTEDPAEIRRQAVENFQRGGTAHMGGWAQAQARNKESMKRAGGRRAYSGYEDAEGRWQDFSTRVARVGRHTLLRGKSGLWIHTRVPAGATPVVLKRGTEAYERLVANDEFARLTAVGDELLVLWNGTVYRIVE